MEVLKKLNDPNLTARFQKFCGVSYPNIQNCEECQKQHENNNQELQKLDRCSKCRVRVHENFGSAFLFYLFSFSSSLGNEVFYLLFYPYCVWNVDSILIRRTALVWSLCMYVGQAGKDYFWWPRPSSPPVIRLETEFLQESSMPSTHAASATAIPFMLAYYLLARYEISPYLVLPVAFLWCTLVCLSRLYLGVHTVLDLLCGVGISLVIMVISFPFLEDFDWYQQTHPFAPFVVLTTAIAMCTVLYPQSKDGSSSKGDAVQIVSVLTGVSIGSWLNYYFHFTTTGGLSGPYDVNIPTVRDLAIQILRFFIGVVIIALLKLTLKEITVRLFSKFYGLKTPNPEHPSVKIAYKFAVYGTIGFSVVFLVPFIHCMFGLERETYFQEVV
ncbi:sphingosine-1-phosphate phosphatase 2-like [Saccostrea cucullata]|uniref:sphingosine-1-phosphate phosphatase 2-like n=1 Tax=Saccostrea cuccullata TaxID=36930 RepID=UPI002ED353D3